MKTNNPYDDLKIIELTDYECRAYFALLECNLLAASALSKKAGIPYSKTYEVLSKLETKKLIEVQYSRPMLYRALNPTMALQRLIDTSRDQEDQRFRRQKQILEKEHQQAMNRFSRMENESMRRAASLYKQSTAVELTTETVWTIRSPENVISRLIEILESAKKKIQLMLPKDDFSRVIKPLRACFKRGVEIQLIIHNITTSVEQIKESVDLFKEESPLPTNCGVAIVDGSAAMFLSEDYESGFSTESASVVTVLNHFCEHEIIESVSL